ncbi:helix-turn-helix domain-containing protein [Halorubrum ezzemoulense]|uniref:Helix-turn-helix domain-containing protein n=1 Tax=Halorubrum ezzemoulense TaxID=337243 RepID=A0ABT4Z7J4_HALEZ|nr:MULTISPECIES: helix-turn-helix domain-containing protein [Halorubrum]MDB2252478.1 helix-turn-helix domain-containing protein [Halorubrum ezzemoulense]MDB2293937.1 helix-turn-helix domain-containing protein [Halorubrum ezzemoulense]MDB9235851.1 helix-turn-helix domain-containing protein [Halorubrum ezzemoulense]TKX40376.1 MarR family transcriptional regulator [Halorubrum sp. CGM4_25_10-8A]TKX64513.1 MarR family transcriptional regulator [Halorubrum sp. GN12_10-3_MGM]
MPVYLENHDPELDLRPGTTKSNIVAHLYRNPEWGFSPKDLDEDLGIPRGTATTTLARLYDEEYVGKTEDGYYHALPERDDLHRYVRNLDQVNRLFGHHRDTDDPDPEAMTPAEEPDDADLEAELDELEADLQHE